MGVIAPQGVGGRGVIPFWAAAHEVIFDLFTSDSWTPGASVATLFQGAKSEVKPYPFLKALWLNVTTASGSGAGNNATDFPGSVLSIFRFTDPNGHAIIDTDGYGLFLLNKYGGYNFVGDPTLLPGYVSTAASPAFSLYVPFQFSTLGVGSLPNMDASGPYRIFAQGGTSAAIYSTAPASTTPTYTVNVGLEAWSLPASQSRVNGSPQVQAPPPLDRGVALVREYTKQAFSINSGGGLQTIRLTRVGNIISKLILVCRDSTGARISWTAGSGPTLQSGTTISFAFDTNPLFQASAQHLVERMLRTTGDSTVVDTGVLVIPFDEPTALRLQTDAFDAGMDAMLQTAQSTALELTFSWSTHASGAGYPAGGTLECYTLDVTATTVTGQPYSFAYAGQLLAPVPPGSLRS